MTVTYGEGSLCRLIFKWKGSLWKSVWKELLVFLSCYIAINLVYRFAFNEYHQKEFQGVVHFTNEWIGYIPLQFILGFFVSFVIDRWWSQLMTIPYPDKFLLCMTSHISGEDREAKQIRRTIGRWILLHCVLVWREISKKVKKRFPTDNHLLKAGLITHDEFNLYSNTASTYGVWWVPINWAAGCLTDCKNKGLYDGVVLQSLLELLYDIRSGNGMLTMYDWINVPLRYIQVATFATYGYFALCLIGRQTVTQTFEKTRIDLYFPIVTIIEFVFYIGWLKVADVQRIPFGDDDDDFDMNYILDRNFQVTQLIVDDVASQKPKIVKDFYWNKPEVSLPHTKASFKVRDRIPKWRLDGMKLTRRQKEIEVSPFYLYEPPSEKNDAELCNDPEGQQKSGLSTRRPSENNDKGTSAHENMSSPTSGHGNKPETEPQYIKKHSLAPLQVDQLDK